MAIRYLKIALIVVVALQGLLFALQNIANLDAAFQAVAYSVGRADHAVYPESIGPTVTSPWLVWTFLSLILAGEFSVAGVAVGPPVSRVTTAWDMAVPQLQTGVSTRAPQHGLEGGRGTRGRAPLQIDAGVDRDAVHPAREPRLEAELADLAEEDPEGLLGGVQSVGRIARDAEADVVDPVPVALVQVPERTLEPRGANPSAGEHQCTVGIGASGTGHCGARTRVHAFESVRIEFTLQLR